MASMVGVWIRAYQLPLDAWRAIRTVVEAEAQARKDANQSWGTLGYMVAEVWKGQDAIRDEAYGQPTRRRCSRPSTSRGAMVCRAGASRR
jgi:predicted aconitase